MAVEASTAPAEAPAASTPVRAIFDKAFSETPSTRNALAELKKSKPEATRAVAPETATVPEAKPVPEVEPTSPEPESPDAPEETETAAPETEETAAPEQKEKYRWGELKKEVKTQKETIAKLTQELQQKGVASEELTRTKSELDRVNRQIEEANKELYLSRVEATPEWQKGVTAPMNEIFGQVDMLAKQNNIDANKLYEAIHKASIGDNTSLKEIYEGVDEPTKFDIHSLTKSQIQINNRVKDLKDNSKQALEASMRNRQEEAQKQTEQMRKTYQQAADRIGEKFSSKASEFLPDGHEVNFDDVKAESQNVDNWSPEEKVFAGYAASVLPDLLSTVETWKQRALKAEQTNAKLRGASPKSNGGVSPSAPSAAATKPSQTDLAKTSMKSFAESSMARLTGRA